MLELEEKYTGKVLYDEINRSLSAGRLMINVDDIEDMVFCESCTAVFGRKDEHPDPSSAAIAFRLKTSISHPGRLFSASKTKNLLLRFPDCEAAKKLFFAIPIEEKNLCLPDYTRADFPLKTCIVEAKKGMNNYTRGGTAGSRPYQKLGLVAPVIKPEFNLDAGSVTIHYMGLNIADHESLWFREHPHDEFFFEKCTDITFLINLYDERAEVTGRFERYDIERDEKATGLWSVVINNSYTSLCDALRWINTLIYSYKQIPHEAVSNEAVSNKSAETIEIKETAQTSNPTQKLNDALSLLKDAEIITEIEYAIMKERIDKKR